ncbi:MAG: hypothetical protein HXS47_05820 [Theionarchaea archaeon]|nr:hypothetical protein [Theionarchaea archaeon]
MCPVVFFMHRESQSESPPLSSPFNSAWLSWKRDEYSSFNECIIHNL